MQYTKIKLGDDLTFGEAYENALTFFRDSPEQRKAGEFIHTLIMQACRDMRLNATRLDRLNIEQIRELFCRLAEDLFVAEVRVTNNPSVTREDDERQSAIGNMCGKVEGGVARNPSKAMQWYLRAAQNGSSCGQFNVALCYLNGEGTAMSPAGAAGWFMRAAE